MSSEKIERILSEIAKIQLEITEIQAMIHHVNLKELHEKLLKIEGEDRRDELKNIKLRISTLEKFKWQVLAVTICITFLLNTFSHVIPFFQNVKV